MNRRPGVLALSVAALCWSACNSGLGPSSTAPRVTSIAPASGTTLGGTAVTILGANFAAGASVSIGGSPATSVVFVNANTMTAVTPQHAAASGDVVVTVAGRSGMLPRGYAFVAPAPVVNQAPTIAAISVRGSAPREPAQYATVGETVSVSASVTDVETAINQMTFDWASTVGGVFSGSGANVTWTAPNPLSGTPLTATLTLVVTERYSTTTSDGLPTTSEHRVTGTSSVRVHNSVREVSDLAGTFLLDFSRQLEPTFVMRNFTPSCRGTAEELDDVLKNQREFIITSYSIGTAATTVPFTGSCSFRTRFGDACALVPVEWHSTIKATGQAIWTRGIDQVTAILENDQWRLCASDYDETAASPPVLLRGLRFKR